MFDPTFWEIASYIVTVIGLPVAIVIFAFEQRKQRANEEDEIHQLLSDSYSDFLKLVIDNPDLRLLSSYTAPEYSAEQSERALALYSILISIFERAYIMTYAPERKGRRDRYWTSWEDLIDEWCQRGDFLLALPELLVGEDPDFATYMREAAARHGVRAIEITGQNA